MADIVATIANAASLEELEKIVSKLGEAERKNLMTVIKPKYKLLTRVEAAKGKSSKPGPTGK